jgi:hypothetical protein
MAAAIFYRTSFCRLTFVATSFLSEFVIRIMGSTSLRWIAPEVWQLELWIPQSEDGAFVGSATVAAPATATADLEAWSDLSTSLVALALVVRAYPSVIVQDAKVPEYETELMAPAQIRDT